MSNLMFYITDVSEVQEAQTMHASHSPADTYLPSLVFFASMTFEPDPIFVVC